MTPEQERLLGAVAADPEEDAPRLAYASWLEANGEQARAEFIRVQIEAEKRWSNKVWRFEDWDKDQRYRKMAAWGDGGEEVIPLLDRQAELFREHGQRWLGELPEGIRSDSSWTRGFLDKITITLADLLTHGQQWLRLLPAPEVHVKDIGTPRQLPPAEGINKFSLAFKAFMDKERFGGVGEAVQSLARWPGLARIRRLNLSFNELTEDHVADLLASPHLAELEELDLCNNKQIGPKAAQAIAASPRMRNLRSLNLSGNIGLEGVRALAQSPHLADLRELKLSSGQLGDEGAQALATSPYLCRLQGLDVGCNGIGPQGIGALCESENFRHLTRLDVLSNDLGDAGVRRLARSEAFPILRSLDLRSVGLSPAGAAELGRSADWPGLTSLDLEGNAKLDAQGLLAILSSPRFGGLRSLSLENCSLGDTVADAFDRASCSLASLKLHNNFIGPEGAKRLARCAALAGLRVLRIEGNPIGSEGFAALMKSPHLEGLHDIIFDSCEVGREGIRALVRSQCFPHLRYVELLNKQLDDEVARDLASSEVLAGWTILELSGNCISDAGVSALARSAHARNLREINLGGNRIGDEGARALAESPHLEKLQRLNLTDNPLTVAGWRLLRQRFGDGFLFGSYKTEEDWEKKPNPVEKEEGDS
jgi:uncharacterized protein (TIGR02996 family)